MKYLKNFENLNVIGTSDTEFEKGDHVYCIDDTNSSLVFGEEYIITYVQGGVNVTTSYNVYGKKVINQFPANGCRQSKKNSGYGAWRFTKSKKTLEEIKKQKLEDRFDL